MATLKVDDISQLSAVAAELRADISSATLPGKLEEEVRTAYGRMCNDGDLPVAVRSSATAEDLPEASFAGQQDTLLNVLGEDSVVAAVKQVFASLFTDRSIAYRAHHGFDHTEVGISAGIQRMVRSDQGASGVMFTLDTESGFDGVVFITSAYGLGEAVVQGAVEPDEFYVHKRALDEGREAVIRRSMGAKAVKMVFADGGGVRNVDVPAEEQQRFSLSDDELAELARHARAIERHYGRHMDIEWGKDGIDDQLYILQARPETVQSARLRPCAPCVATRRINA